MGQSHLFIFILVQRIYKFKHKEKWIHTISKGKQLCTRLIVVNIKITPLHIKSSSLSKCFSYSNLISKSDQVFYIPGISESMVFQTSLCFYGVDFLVILTGCTWTLQTIKHTIAQLQNYRLCKGCVSSMVLVAHRELNCWK